MNGGGFRRQIGELNTLLAPAPTERAEFTLCGPANSLVVSNGHTFVGEYFRKVASYLSFRRTCDPDLSIPIFERYGGRALDGRNHGPVIPQNRVHECF